MKSEIEFMKLENHVRQLVMLVRSYMAVVRTFPVEFKWSGIKF